MSIDNGTYQELFEQVGSYVQDTSSGRQAQIKEALNREYGKASQAINWPHLLRFKALNLPNSSTLYLPKDMGTIMLMVDIDRDVTIEGNDVQQLYRRFAGNIDVAGDSFKWGFDGEYGKKDDFVADETITVESTSGSDVTQAVRIWGLDSDGEEQTESITLTGTTPATSTLTYSDLTRVSVSDFTRVGKVRVKGTTSVAEYVTITNVELTARYKRIRIAGNSQNNILVFYKKRLTRLINDDDVLELPMFNYLFERTVGKILQLQRKVDQGLVHIQEAEGLKLDILAELESFSQTNRVAAPSRESSLKGGRAFVIKNA